MSNPDPMQWLADVPRTPATIEELVDDGCMGCAVEDLIPWLRDGEVFSRIATIEWQKTTADAEGDVALMTADVEGLDSLLEWMLDSRGQCPQVYAPEEEPEVPAAIPLLRPLATNLPEGMTSEEAFADGVLECMQETFASVKEAFGNQAHLLRVDYGAFADALREHEVLFLKGEFIDLTDGEIFEFTADGFRRKLSYRSTGRKDEAFRPAERAVPETGEVSRAAR